MSSRNEAEDEQSGAIDLTPMLDVVFIMLIFFIVTATFIKETGVEVDRPDATTAEEKKDASILIAITDGDEIWIDKQEVDPRGVRAQIERLLADNPNGSVVIQADAEASVKLLAEVADTARQLSVSNIAVSTVKN
ncbi:biopolymer transporter ExbD [Gilvimarinus agarilyticus]|uniref:ExbD/TolR family protein n=1 Tax=unclassified Gilvimarinus TaxID=2642066 RepID=UPI001C09A812|nr:MULTISPECIES: biopolymer transporter ExbD [unclassified Gilvimarinus]MBU2886593.1 biopolymer transporter ExbD [Gilvimarinus agarilyticus]MDO6571261.1 biopolymer transporter ExbD [Gilvimarinus sp. 2_MG-2023]MDO6746364.1 biopolymer transporter ExbD [Gilvimarinus sp. 1_MG-2023]